MPCICEPARKAEIQGRGMGYLTLWYGTCSAEDHRDTIFYEPQHEVGHNGLLNDWVMQPDVPSSETTTSQFATPGSGKARGARW
jgi:hypothetical protein